MQPNNNFISGVQEIAEPQPIEFTQQNYIGDSSWVDDSDLQAFDPSVFEPSVPLDGYTEPTEPTVVETYSGSFLPFKQTTDSEGGVDISFDSDAGIVGSIKENLSNMINTFGAALNGQIPIMVPQEDGSMVINPQLMDITTGLVDLQGIATGSNLVTSGGKVAGNVLTSGGVKPDYSKGRMAYNKIAMENTPSSRVVYYNDTVPEATRKAWKVKDDEIARAHQDYLAAKSTPKEKEVRKEIQDLLGKERHNRKVFIDQLDQKVVQTPDGRVVPVSSKDGTEAVMLSLFKDDPNKQELSKLFFKDKPFRNQLLTNNEKLATFYQAFNKVTEGLLASGTKVEDLPSEQYITIRKLMNSIHNEVFSEGAKFTRVKPRDKAKHHQDFSKNMGGPFGTTFEKHTTGGPANHFGVLRSKTKLETDALNEEEAVDLMIDSDSLFNLTPNQIESMDMNQLQQAFNADAKANDYLNEFNTRRKRIASERTPDKWAPTDQDLADEIGTTNARLLAELEVDVPNVAETKFESFDELATVASKLTDNAKSDLLSQDLDFNSVKKQYKALLVNRDNPELGQFIEQRIQDIESNEAFKRAKKGKRLSPRELYKAEQEAAKASQRNADLFESGYADNIVSDTNIKGVKKDITQRMVTSEELTAETYELAILDAARGVRTPNELKKIISNYENFLENADTLGPEDMDGYVASFIERVELQESKEQVAKQLETISKKIADANKKDSMIGHNQLQSELVEAQEQLKAINNRIADTFKEN